MPAVDLTFEESLASVALAEHVIGSGQVPFNSLSAIRSALTADPTATIQVERCFHSMTTENGVTECIRGSTCKRGT